MNVVTNIWRQLVRRRLWPVALLLLAALAAVPVVLARGPEPVPVPADPAPAATGDAGDALAEPVVAKVEAEDRSHRRRVLGARKDPFEPAPLPKPKEPKAPKAQKAPKAGASGEPSAPKHAGGSVAPSSPSSGLTSPVGGGGPSVSLPTAPVPAAPTPKKKHYPAGSLIVRFGDATGDSLDRRLVRKLDPLPDDETPVLVYLGLTKNHKKAIFLIDDTVTPDGDGTCKPHPSSCEEVELSKGETEFFEVTDPETGEVAAQYQLDLVAINHS